jgi:hypothetical protein
MSKFSTDELTDRICWPTREETKNAIIAKLRAADRLCEAAKRIDEDALSLANQHDLRIALANYREK